jgi:hypothetical protein
MSEALPPYPSTKFLDIQQDGLEPLALSPLALNLVRGVYLAQFLGQTDTLLTDFVARVNTVEVAFWSPDERQQYEPVREEVSNFFECNKGSTSLAVRSTLGYGFRSEEEALSLVEKKIQYLWLGWLQFRDNLPSVEELQETELLTENMPLLPADDDDPDEGRFRKDFVQLFIEADKDAVRRGRLTGTFDADPYESMVRELLVRGRITGYRGLDYWLKGCRGVLQEKSLGFLMTMLVDSWEMHHPNEQFRVSAE